MTDEFTGVDAASRIELDTIEAAAQRIAPHIVTTPILESPRLNDWLGFRLLIKPENLQHTGSFKLRGASNAIWSLNDDVSRVFAYSSGNHAQGVAMTCQKLRLQSSIVMPLTTPTIKVNAVKKLGSKVILSGDTYDEAYNFAIKYAKENNYNFVHCLDDFF